MHDLHESRIADISWSATTTLAVQPEQLFRYLSDFTSARLWDPQVADAQLIDTGKIGTGSKFTLDYKIGAFVVPLTYEIVEFDAPHRIILKGSADNFEGTDEVHVKPDPANPAQSQLTYSLNIHFKKRNFMAAKFGQLMVNRVAKQALRNLQRLPFNDSGRIKHYPRILDKTLLGLFQFTKFGFYQAKRNSQPLPVTSSHRVVLTGCTSGIGREIAIELARAQVELIIINRDATKALELVQELQKRFDANVHSYICDLSNINQTLATARRIRKDFPTLDGLINNAGVLLNERQETNEGLETNFAVLLMAPFVLTQTLLPALEANATQDPARVINMCSGGLYTQGLHLDDLQYEKGKFNGAKAYARAKRGLLDITEHQARLYDKYKVVFHAMHPGWVLTPGVEKSMKSFLKVTRKVLREPFQGADTAVWLALAETPAKSSGLFWLDRAQHTTSVFPGTKTHPSEQAELFNKLESMMKTLDKNKLHSVDESSVDGDIAHHNTMHKSA